MYTRHCRKSAGALYLTANPRKKYERAMMTYPPATTNQNSLGELEKTKRTRKSKTWGENCLISDLSEGRLFAE